MSDRNGYHKVTAYLCAKGAAEAIEFYKAAFGAKEQYRWLGPDGQIGHAEIMIGDSLVMLSDEAPDLGVLSPHGMPGHSVSFVLDVDDADAAFQRAVAAGATVTRPLKDEPYGRGGWLVDPFGHHWSVMTPNPDFNPAELT
jgi:PhnB protein